MKHSIWKATITLLHSVLPTFVYHHTQTHVTEPFHQQILLLPPSTIDRIRPLCPRSTTNIPDPATPFFSTSTTPRLWSSSNISSPHRRQSNFLERSIRPGHSPDQSPSKAFSVTSNWTSGMAYQWPTMQSLAPLTFPAPIPPAPSAPSDHLSLLACSLHAKQAFSSKLVPQRVPSVPYPLLALRSGLWSEAFPPYSTFKISSYLPLSPAVATIWHLLHTDLFGHLHIRNVSSLREGIWLFTALSSRTLNGACICTTKFSKSWLEPSHFQWSSYPSLLPLSSAGTHKFCTEHLPTYKKWLR